jgi:hypothetical protein
VNKRSNLRSRIEQAVAQIDMTNWPAPVIHGAVLDHAPSIHATEAGALSA